MTPNSGSGRGRRTSWMLFLGLLVLGLVMLVARALALPNVGMGQMILPLIGGLVIAGAIVVIVRRDRAERNSLPADKRNRQDQGMPD